MKKHIKMLGIAFALILTTMGTTNIFAASKGYNAYVSKVSDFESSSLTKKNDESATNHLYAGLKIMQEEMLQKKEVLQVQVYYI